VLNDYTLCFALAEHRTGLEVSANLYSVRETSCFCCECNYEYMEKPPIRTRTFYDYALSFKGHIVGRYVGFSIGMNLITMGNQYCHEGSDLFVFPTFELKTDILDKVYISVSLMDYYRRSIVITGINYIFSNPLNRIWLDYGTLDKDRHFGFESQLNPFGNLLLLAQGGYFHEEYRDRLGCRIGLGWVLR